MVAETVGEQVTRVFDLLANASWLATLWAVCDDQNLGSSFIDASDDAPSFFDLFERIDFHEYQSRQTTVWEELTHSSVYQAL